MALDQRRLRAFRALVPNRAGLSIGSSAGTLGDTQRGIRTREATMKRFILLAVVAALLALPQLATSRVAANTVEPTAALSKQGRRAEVGVLLTCDKTQRARLRVTVTQHLGAFAQGRRKARCTTAQQRFAVKAKARRKIDLAPGDATVCVLALTRDDARQWCKDITLQ
jgi:hypothetical protein